MNRLKARIIERYGTQKAFAAAAGLHMNTVSRWVNGTRDIQKSRREEVARLLDVSEGDLMAYFFDNDAHKCQH